jgi:hypothetical protein
MISPTAAGLLIGFVLMLVAVVSNKEKWQIAYSIVGLIFILWGLGYFNIGMVLTGLGIPLLLLFFLFSMFTKGTAQLASILITLLLLFNVVIV